MWERHAWLDLLQRFVHVVPPPKGAKVPGITIFPRYHQWDAVRCRRASSCPTGATP